MKEKQVVLATHNQGKIREFQEALRQIGGEGIPIQDICHVLEPAETGTTFMENAILKATYYMKASGLPCLADDSGLAVDALDGAPGVYSARYAGEQATDTENNEKLQRELAGVPETDRTARYVCVLALVYPDGTTITAEGTCEGCIKSEAEGDGGFGYDPYFYVPQFGTTMASLSLADKNSISHRGKALAALVAKWPTGA